MWPPAQGRLGPQKLGGRRPLPWYPHLEPRVPASRAGRQPFLLLPTPVWYVVLCRGPHEQKPLCVQNVSGGVGPSRQGTMGPDGVDTVPFVYSKTNEIIFNFK